MTDATRSEYDRDPVPGKERVPDDSAALHADIEETRERLGETVDEIGRRLDVRTRMREIAHDAGQRVGDVRQRANEVSHRVGAYGRAHPTTVAVGGAALVVAVGMTILACRRWER